MKITKVECGDVFPAIRGQTDKGWNYTLFINGVGYRFNAKIIGKNAAKQKMREHAFLIKKQNGLIR